MKTLTLIFAIFFLSDAKAMPGIRAWKNSNMNGKVFILNEYKAFFSELQKTEKLSEISSYQKSFLKILMNSAWAAPDMDCIYAGWPSKRINNLCSSPARHNPDYKNASCGKNQLQCQPLLFSKGLCVSVVTSQERNLAFSNCEKLYKAKNQSPESLINEIRAEGNEPALFELMDFADGICKNGKQAGTGMCSRLLAAVDRLRHFKESTPPVTAALMTTRTPAVSDEGTAPRTSEERELIETVAVASQAIQAVSAQDCEPDLVGESFDREEPRPFDFEYSTTRQGSDPAFDIAYLKDAKSEELRHTGFEITNTAVNAIAGPSPEGGEPTERKWRFVSEDNSRRETYLWITDDPGTGRLSDLMDSVIMLVPRKMKPKVEAVGDDLHVTLSTGEKVIYDKKTKTVKAGVLSESAIDTNKNKQHRKFAQVNYKGSGISIRVNKRGEDPRLIPGQAAVTQNGETCLVPAKDLWNSNADFKFSDDKKLVEFLNNKCRRKFKI